MPLVAGELFAGFTIIELLGAGGMGEVYLAEHPRLPRQEALKILPADVSADPEFRQRFHREAELAASLSHPHIVAVHDRGKYDGQLWISRTTWTDPTLVSCCAANEMARVWSPRTSSRALSPSPTPSITRTIRGSCTVM
jgi:hypothetical protein